MVLIYKFNNIQYAIYNIEYANTFDKLESYTCCVTIVTLIQKYEILYFLKKKIHNQICRITNSLKSWNLEEISYKTIKLESFDDNFTFYWLILFIWISQILNLSHKINI